MKCGRVIAQPVFPAQPVKAIEGINNSDICEAVI